MAEAGAISPVQTISCVFLLVLLSRVSSHGTHCYFVPHLNGSTWLFVRDSYISLSTGFQTFTLFPIFDDKHTVSRSYMSRLFVANMQKYFFWIIPFFRPFSRGILKDFYPKSDSLSFVWNYNLTILVIDHSNSFWAREWKGSSTKQWRFCKDNKSILDLRTHI